MLILSLGVPRSGTILVFNVLREILTRNGISFESVNTNYPETAAFLRAFDFKRNVLLHAHNVLPEVQQVLARPEVTAFFNQRDPRDVVVSMMRLHDYTFERCLELVEISFAHWRKAREFPGILFIPYEELMGDVEGWITRIGGHLDLPVPPEDVRPIREATSLDAHRRIMQDVAREAVPVQVRRNPRRVLRESATHFINDRHIQSGRPGRWREEMDRDQQRIATATFRPLLHDLGYPEQ